MVLTIIAIVLIIIIVRHIKSIATTLDNIVKGSSGLGAFLAMGLPIIVILLLLAMLFSGIS